MKPVKIPIQHIKTGVSVNKQEPEKVPPININEDNITNNQNDEKQDISNEDDHVHINNVNTKPSPQNCLVQVKLNSLKMNLPYV